MKSTIIYLLLSSFTFITCKSADEREIKDVARNFFEAVNHFDFATAKMYATPESGNLLNEVDEWANSKGLNKLAKNNFDYSSFKIECGEPKIVNDNAVVPVRWKFKTDTLEHEWSESKLPLKKVNGYWKVDVDLKTLHQLNQ